MPDWRFHPRDTPRLIYHIRVKGSLDPKWADWFEGFVMVSRTDGETLLSGTVTDQAALHGVLNKINSLGLALLLVAQADCPCPSKGCSNRGQCSACVAHEAERNNLPFCFRPNNHWDRRCDELK